MRVPEEVSLEVLARVLDKRSLSGVLTGVLQGFYKEFKLTVFVSSWAKACIRYFRVPSL